jgi:hypothetical protein
MERNYSFNLSAGYQKLSLLVSKVHDRSRKSTLTLEAIKTSRGLALVFVAIILAWISLEFTQSEATDHYVHSHWPKAQVWTQTLEARGLVSQKNLGSFSELLKSHPRPFSGEQKIWVSSDACVVYLTKSPYQSNPELWTCAPNAKPSQWLAQGSGLYGFEKLIDFFAKTPLIAHKLQKPGTYKIDPKEIRY